MINTQFLDLKTQGEFNNLDKIILPNQTHSNHIIEIVTGEEDLTSCDGLFTSIKNNYLLGVRTADCGAIAMYDNNYYGIIHSGWRGLVSGIIEKMLDKFNDPKVFVFPLLREFEIQKDDCYRLIKEKFGERFFNVVDDRLIFDFIGATSSVLPQNTIYDNRDTFSNLNIASWRRDGDNKRNVTVIYRED